MKILVVCQYYFPENNVLTNICEELVKLGNDVTVLTGKPNYGYGEIIPEYKKIKYQEIHGVKVHRVNLYPRKKSRLSIIRNYLSFWGNSKKWVKNCKEKFDIVYSMSMSPVTILSAGNIYKKKHHVKHVVHCVDLWPESVIATHAVRKNSLTYKILYKWSRKLYSQVDHVIIGSPSYKEYFKDVLKLDVDTSFVALPSLVEVNNAEPHKYNKPFNILYCGNLGLIQLIDLIPETMKEINNSNIQFHVIGMGPKSNELLDLINKYSLEDKVIYHGPIVASKAASYFASADVLYVSLDGSGYVGKTIPNKLMMSLAFGKPIIGVLDGDGKDILIKAGGNIIAKPNPESVAEAINKMYSLSTIDRKEMGIKNREYYFSNLSIDKCGLKVNKILSDELLQK